MLPFQISGSEPELGDLWSYFNWLQPGSSLVTRRRRMEMLYFSRKHNTQRFSDYDAAAWAYPDTSWLTIHFERATANEEAPIHSTDQSCNFITHSLTQSVTDFCICRAGPLRSSQKSVLCEGKWQRFLQLAGLRYKALKMDQRLSNQQLRHNGRFPVGATLCLVLFGIFGKKNCGLLQLGFLFCSSGCWFHR